MEKQSFQKKDDQVIEAFVKRRKNGSSLNPSLRLSWSNWGFGTEEFITQVKRCAKNNITWIELHGNRYGPDLGYKKNEVLPVLEDHDIKVAGLCGMVSPDSELATNKPHIRQRCIDYFRRNIEMCAELGGDYILFSPGAVGRPEKYDDNEMPRAAELLNILGDDFVSHNVRAAIEPVRSAEVSICHTFAEAKQLIEMVDHPGVKHIAGDLYHMLTEEEHIGKTIMDYSDYLITLHFADSNRRALGLGSLDLDIVIMALYAIGYDEGRKFCTPEPLGPGGDPYPAMFGTPNKEAMDSLVRKTAETFYAREKEVLTASDDELRRYGGEHG